MNQILEFFGKLFKNTSWELIDADVIAAKYQYTFYKPSEKVVSKVAVGETVKLIFGINNPGSDSPRAERMWVIVEEIRQDGSFAGRLDNKPVEIVDLKLGDRIEFSAKHIINTQHDDPDNLVNRYSKRCFVTNRVLYEGFRVGYLYREKPDLEDDSGWRITANNESQEYMDDAKNGSYVSLGAVLNKDDSFVSLLEHPADIAFEFDQELDQFVSVEPPKPI